jgi:lactoylglutathione lyase
LNYKLFAVRVFVTDWERAIRFYTETLGMPIAFRSDETGWVHFATGGGQLALERVEPTDREGMALVGRFVGVSLQVGNLHGAYKTLLERGVDGPPEEQPWGGVLAHLRDPDGNVLTLLGSDD